MNFKGEYISADGKSEKITINGKDSRQAVINDYNAVKAKYNPNYVEFRREPAQAGEMLHLVVKVKAPSHYLTSKTDVTPKPCSSMSCHVVVYAGYPLKAISAWYEPSKYLASPNVFSCGAACIDKWKVFKSSLVTVVDKLVNDMIHNPLVSKYKDVANYDMVEWHKKNVREGKFPTIKPFLLEMPEKNGGNGSNGTGFDAAPQI